MCGREIERVKASAKNLRSGIGFQNEMNLLLASLRRVEIRIEPESITDFLKWKNRMAEYNRAGCRKGWWPRKRRPTDSCWERLATETAELSRSAAR